MGKPKTARKKPLGKKNKPPKKHTRRLAGVIKGLGLLGVGSSVAVKKKKPDPANIGS